MQDIRIDAEGNHHCWKCGGTNFTEKRTLRSKAAVGVGALLTKKKLKCQDCGAVLRDGNFGVRCALCQRKRQRLIDSGVTSN